MYRVRFYVDGLNFHYGVSRKYNFKWIDIEGLLQELVTQIEPQAVVEKILIFTSKARLPDARARQATYLSALKLHSTCIEIVEGYHSPVRKSGVLKNSKDNQIVAIDTYEEKGTDVNLACQIVDDTYSHLMQTCDEFDIACLVSSDGDLAAALKIRTKHNLRTLLIKPRAEHTKSPKQGHLGALIPKGDRILTIPKKLVVKHPLPPKVGKYYPPPIAGWDVF